MSRYQKKSPLTPRDELRDSLQGLVNREGGLSAHELAALMLLVADQEQATELDKLTADIEDIKKKIENLYTIAGIRAHGRGRDTHSGGGALLSDEDGGNFSARLG